MKRSYLDHNATSPLRPAARAALTVELGSAALLGNPSSAHAEGRRARRLLEDARESIAALLGAERDGVVFTSGGSEANTQTLSLARGGHVITTRIEHPSILANLAESAAEDAAPTTTDVIPAGGLPIWLDLDAVGRVDGDGSDELALASSEGGPALWTVALANHETGVIQDVARLAAQARAAGVLTHTDASQAVGRIPVSFAELDVDLMTVCAHKFGGPPGIGALVLRRGTGVPALVRGGGQEAGQRAGTEACLLASAFAAGLDEALTCLPEHSTRWSGWRDTLLSQLRQLIPELQLNSPPNDGLPNTLNVSFPGRDGQALVHRLDLEGVGVSHGSACASGSLEPSPVIRQITGDESRARSAVRISFGWNNIDADVDRLVAAVSRLLRDARSHPSVSSPGSS